MSNLLVVVEEKLLKLQGQVESHDISEMLRHITEREVQQQGQGWGRGGEPEGTLRLEQQVGCGVSFLSKEEKPGLVGSDGRTGEPGMTLDRSTGRVQSPGLSDSCQPAGEEYAGEWTVVSPRIQALSGSMVGGGTASLQSHTSLLPPVVPGHFRRKTAPLQHPHPSARCQCQGQVLWSVCAKGRWMGGARGGLRSRPKRRCMVW